MRPKAGNLDAGDGFGAGVTCNCVLFGQLENLPVENLPVAPAYLCTSLFESSSFEDGNKTLYELHKNMLQKNDLRGKQ